MAVVLTLVSFTGARSTVTAAQQTTGDAAASWAATIDAYIETRAPLSTLPLLRLSPEELRALAREDRERWLRRVRAGRLASASVADLRNALRHLEAAAVAPLELLLPLSAHHTKTDQWSALEQVATDASESLAQLEPLALDPLSDTTSPKDRAHPEQFRAAWRVAFLQYLLNTHRLHDFRLLAGMTSAGSDAALRAELAFLRGMVDENVGRLADDASSTGMPSASTPDSRLQRITGALADANTWYRRALADAPGHAEARLRYGRVLLERRRPEEAVATLTPLASSPCLETTCGLALLFIGEAHEALSAPDRAGEAYARASSALAVRQSALIALMHLAMRRGDAPAATALTRQFAASSPLAAREAPDSWSVYLSGRRQNVEAVLGPLRRAALR